MAYNCAFNGPATLDPSLEPVKDVGLLVAGPITVLLGALLYWRRKRFFADEIWRRSRLLRFLGHFLLIVPGLNLEMQLVLRPQVFTKPDLAQTGIEVSRVLGAVVLILVGVAASLVGVILAFPE